MSAPPVVIITGAAGGIGRAITYRFVKAGYIPVLTDKDNDGLATLAEELAGKKNAHLAIPGNLEEAAFLQHLVNTVQTTFHRIDVLVNNAAWRNRETLRTLSLADWEKTIRVCLTAPAFLMKYVAGVMENKGIPGAMVNISSIQSFFAGGTSPAYTACKSALESLTYEAAVLYGPSGIRVNAVIPGAVHTALSKDITGDNQEDLSPLFTDAMIDHSPLKRLGEPAEIANAVYWLASREASFITGTAIVADGGFTHNFNAYTLKKRQFPEQF